MSTVNESLALRKNEGKTGVLKKKEGGGSWRGGGWAGEPRGSSAVGWLTSRSNLRMNWPSHKEEVEWILWYSPWEPLKKGCKKTKKNCYSGGRSSGGVSGE